MEAKALPGFRDFYPDITALRNHIFAAWRRVAVRYGFEEYDGPPLESLELYTHKSGPEIVEQLYSFEDKGGRAVALRPEMTPTLARMVAARAPSMKKPIRWFAIPQLFRFERQQRGRLKEHFQLNLDLIGESGPLADVEVIAAGIDIMRELGLSASDVRVRVSDRRVIRALLREVCGVPEDDLFAAYAAVDKAERAERSDLVDGLVGQGFSADVAQQVLSMAGRGDLGEIRAQLEAKALGHVVDDLETCVARLHDMGFGDFIEFDSSIVRGLAYYTGIVFEFFDAQRSLRAICGGGRYDGLLQALGGVDLPAVGFGMGDVVLGELLKDRGWVPDEGVRLDAFLVAVTAEDVASVVRLARELREADLRIEYALKLQSVAKQLKLAAARPARYAVVVGPDERATGKVTVRTLETGLEEAVPMVIEELAPRLRVRESSNVLETR